MDKKTKINRVQAARLFVDHVLADSSSQTSFSVHTHLSLASLELGAVLRLLETEEEQW